MGGLGGRVQFTCTLISNSVLLHCLPPFVLCPSHIWTISWFALIPAADLIGLEKAPKFVSSDRGWQTTTKSVPETVSAQPRAKNGFYIFFLKACKMFLKDERQAVETTCGLLSLKHLLPSSLDDRFVILCLRGRHSRAKGIFAFVFAGAGPPASSASRSCHQGVGEGSLGISRNTCRPVEKLFSFPSCRICHWLARDPSDQNREGPLISVLSSKAGRCPLTNQCKGAPQNMATKSQPSLPTFHFITYWQDF